jgi:diguanylate cyclase (GGDEF)-like protein
VHALVALTSFLLGLALLWVRMRRLRLRHELLEKEMETRSAELADSNRKLQKAYERLEEVNALLEDTTAQLVQRAVSDSLTGVGNRKLFEQVLPAEWKRHARHGRYLSLLLIDLDHFKAYNETYGHSAGDDCLRQVAGALRRCIHRADDLLARYGGEEFVALLPETPPEGAKVLADAMRAAVEQIALEHKASAAAHFVTVSVGVASLPADRVKGADELMLAADQALCRAKFNGRNRVER